ncbi:MAG: hypothetical protein R3C52_14970 [Hyphomonadaceae bacterium]
MFNAARLAFDPLIPWLALAGLGGVALVLWAVYLVRGGRAWVFRALALSILALALSNPQWVREQREPLKDIVAVVVDRSESMSFRGRTQTAEAALAQVRDTLEADDTVELRVAETDPEADGTDIYTALQSALSDAPRDRVGGAILITDGRVHDLPQNPNDAEGLGPIQSLIVGGENEIDRRIEIQSAPSFGIVENEVELRIRVDDPTAQNVNVDVSVNGEQHTIRRVETGKPQTVSVRVDRRGDNLIVLQVPEIPNELTLANNLASVNISGVQDRLRVLLVTGQPHAGARVWRDLLKSDPAVDLVHFTILRPPQKSGNDPTPDDQMALISFPRDQLFREKLDEFDLVIFDQELRYGVLETQYLDRVARYVERGGALLVASGPPSIDGALLYQSPIGSVLPGVATGEVVNKRFTPQLTDLGRRHSVTANLPESPKWGPWMRYMRLERGEGEALLQTPDGAPLLLLKRINKGRVAAVMSDQIWLWARGYEGGGPYAELIRRTAHWLMKEPELEEEFLNLTTPSSNTVEAELRTLSDTPEKVKIFAPDGQAVEPEWRLIGPGHYRATATTGALGLYKAEAGPLSAVAVRGPAHPREYVDLRATGDLLQPIATATLGGVFHLGADGSPKLPEIRRVGERGNAAGNNWMGLRHRNAYAVRSTQSIRLLPEIVGMLLAVAFMMLAWRREGR